MKKTLHWIKNILIALIAFVAIYATSVVALGRIPVNNNTTSQTTPTYDIYVRTNGVHTDIVLPTKTDLRDWTQVIPAAELHNVDGRLPYTSFGWGDKGFYLDTPTWADLKASTAFIAATGLGSTAMHIEAVEQPQVSETVRLVRVDGTQLKALIDHIDRSFTYDANGKVMHIDTTANYNEHDAFYEAEGRYSMFTTCNEWTRRGLVAANIKTAMFSPFQDGVMRFLP